MQNKFNLMIFFLSCAPVLYGQEPNRPLTYCNPLDLPYRFQVNEPSRRTNADPSIVLFRDTCFLFASKVGGYYYSTNMVDWKLVSTDDFPLEDWSPAVLNLGDTLMLLITTASNTIYSAGNPLTGKWKVETELPFSAADAAFFMDDDNRLYFFSGLSYKSPVWGIELDIQNKFQPIGKRVDLVCANFEDHGWEIRPDNPLTRAPNIEGPWVNKYNNKYYLQYGAPGTQFDNYGDGVYVSDNPLGPYDYEPYSPFSFKPTGFVRGTGHSSTFTDKHGNSWHFTTVVISDRQKYERRLAMFPVTVTDNGHFYSHNTFGDYPMIVPQTKALDLNDYRTGWQLLSKGKTARASSVYKNHTADLAFDENIKTYWIAETDDAGEWLSVDLGKVFEVYGVQVNFAEVDPGLFGFSDADYHQYAIEYSDDGNSWQIALDKKENKTAVPHDYEELTMPVAARYLRITNNYVPDKHFAIRDFRIFGKANGAPPETPEFTQWYRNNFNQRYFKLEWNEVENATGYLIEYGIHPEELFNHFTIFSYNKYEAVYLNKGIDYYFSVSSFNENGKSKPGEVLYLPASGSYSK